MALLPPGHLDVQQLRTRTFMETPVLYHGSPLSTQLSNTCAKDSLAADNDCQGPPALLAQGMDSIDFLWVNAHESKSRLEALEPGSAFPGVKNGPFSCQAWLFPACPVSLWVFGHSIQMKYSFGWTTQQKREILSLNEKQNKNKTKQEDLRAISWLYLNICSILHYVLWFC